MDLSIARQTRTWSHVVASPVKCKLQQRSKGYVCERDESRLGGGRRGGGKEFILSMLNHLYPPDDSIRQYHRSASHVVVAIPVPVPVRSNWTCRYSKRRAPSEMMA